MVYPEPSRGASVIEDGRSHPWWSAENALFDTGMVRTIGFGAFTLYCYLCRRANQQRQSFPSYSRIGEDLGVSRRQAVRLMQILVDHQLVRITSRQSEQGDADTNVFTVLPVPSPGVVTPMSPGSDKNVTTVVTPMSPGVVTSMSPKEDPCEEDPMKGDEKILRGGEAAPTLREKLGPAPPLLPDGTRRLTEEEFAVYDAVCGLLNKLPINVSDSELRSVRKLFTQGCPAPLFRQVAEEVLASKPGIKSLTYLVRATETRMADMAAEEAQAPTPVGAKTSAPSPAPARGGRGGYYQERRQAQEEAAAVMDEVRRSGKVRWAQSPERNPL